MVPLLLVGLPGALRQLKGFGMAAAALLAALPGQAAGVPMVVAADGVLCDLTRTLAADQARVVCLIPAGTDPHQAALRPRDRQALAEARLVLFNGYGLTPSMVRVVEGRLLAVLPAAAAPGVKQRGQAARTVLDELGSWTGAQVRTVPQGSRVLVTEHRAFSSFARRYGIRELPLLDSFTTAGVLRPNSLAAMTKAIRESGTRQLFAESLPVSKTLRRVSRSSGVPVNPTPLVADGLAPGRSTVQTATGNVCTFVNGQGGRCDSAAADRLAQRWAAIR